MIITEVSYGAFVITLNEGQTFYTTYNHNEYRTLNFWAETGRKRYELLSALHGERTYVLQECGKYLGHIKYIADAPMQIYIHIKGIPYGYYDLHKCVIELTKDGCTQFEQIVAAILQITTILGSNKNEGGL